MATINFPLFLQRHIPKFVVILILTLVEWTLIALLFLNCFLFFFITKFASLFGLQTPCIPCSLFGFKISFDALICNDHAIQTSLKRPKRKGNKKDARGFNYIIYGPPWRVVEYAKNGSVVHKKIKRESEKDCDIVEDGHHKPDFLNEDNSLETMHKRCIIDEERLVPVHLIDEATTKYSNIWFNEEKDHKREFTGKGSLEFLQAGDGKTKLRNEARSTSVGNFSLRKGQVDESIHKTKHQSRNTSSYSSLFGITPIETTLISNPYIKSESPSPKFEEEKQSKREFTGKSSVNLLQAGDRKTKLRNEARKSTSVGNFSLRKDQVDESTHKTKHQSRNTSSYSSLAEITSIETTPLSDPSIRSESPSPKFNEEKHHKREFTGKGSLEFLQDTKTAGDRKTKLKNEARKSTSVGNFSLTKDQVEESIHKTKHQSRHTSSYSSLSEITSIESTPFSNPCIRSESPSPKFDELVEQKTNKPSLNSKSFDSSLFKRNKEYTDREILHSQGRNTSSYRSIFEITPVDTESLVNPYITSEPISDKHDESDSSMMKGNEEEMKGEILIKLDESLDKFEEERCSIIKKLNELKQRLLILQKEELESRNVIEETKPKSEKDYKSLSDFLHCEMNYSTNDLVSLGKGYNQQRDGNMKMKRFQPSLYGFNLKRGPGKEQLAIQEEIDTLSERLQHVNADRELIKQCVKSLMDGVEGISFAEEI